jgi:MSHA biogenesis protein MshK
MTIRHMQGRAGAAMLALAAYVYASAAPAQTLIDPTQPPPEAALARTGPEAAPATVALQQGPRLQSVLVSRRSGGRRVAVIDGRTWRLGELFDGARLVKVSDTEAVLQRGATKQVLKLFGEAPAAAATAAATAATATATATATAAAAGSASTPRALPAAVRQ